MKYAFFLTVIVYLSCLGKSAIGGEPEGKSIDRQLQCARCTTASCCCQECYCRKPIPCLPCLTFCTVAECYCRKPMPCVPCLKPSCCPDDYCRKPLPDLCCPLVVPCGKSSSTASAARSPSRGETQRR